jgi:hypothetical protein
MGSLTHPSDPLDSSEPLLLYVTMNNPGAFSTVVMKDSDSLDRISQVQITFGDKYKEGSTSLSFRPSGMSPLCTGTLSSTRVISGCPPSRKLDHKIEVEVHKTLPVSLLISTFINRLIIVLHHRVVI